MNNNNKKYKVLFPFVEAGYGHIMPLKSIIDAFERKYGDQVTIVKPYFFHKDEILQTVEDHFISEVKKVNKIKGLGRIHFLLLRLFGQKISLNYLFQHQYGIGYDRALDYMKELDPDLIFNTHFATLYYACEAKEKGLIHSKIAAYCPDPILGRQWDKRVEMVGISSKLGKAKANSTRLFKNNLIYDVPFLIRDEVKMYDRDREHYRKQLGIPQDQFTIILADGAYGAGKLRKTIYELLQLKIRVTLIVVCGKNEALFSELSSVTPPENITLLLFGFTDKILLLSAASDLFIGKAGASQLAEVTYFKCPSIVTLCATDIEKWIANHYIKVVKSTIKETNIRKVRKLVERFYQDKNFYLKYQEACENYRSTDGAELLTDYLWDLLQDKDNK